MGPGRVTCALSAGFFFRPGLGCTDCLGHWHWQVCLWRSSTACPLPVQWRCTNAHWLALHCAQCCSFRCTSGMSLPIVQSPRVVHLQHGCEACNCRRRLVGGLRSGRCRCRSLVFRSQNVLRYAEQVLPKRQCASCSRSTGVGGGSGHEVAFSYGTLH